MTHTYTLHVVTEEPLTESILGGLCDIVGDVIVAEGVTFGSVATSSAATPSSDDDLRLARASERTAELTEALAKLARITELLAGDEVDDPYTHDAYLITRVREVLRGGV